MSAVYSIAVENKEIVVRLNKETFDQDDISRFLDYLEFESIRKRSQLTQQDADTLAEEIDSSAWNNLKSSFLGS